MPKATCKTIGRSLPWGLIGMLGLILSVEHVVIRHDLDLIGTVSLNWRYAGRAAASRARDCKILCLGSSIVKMGIGARMIQAGTGKRTFNLAMSAASLPANFYVLRRAIEAGARPDAVLIDCLENGLEPFQVHGNLRNYPELLTVGEIFDIAWQTRDSEFLALMILSRALPSLKDRFEIRNNVLAYFRGQNASSALAGYLARRNWEANHGMWAIPRNPAFEAMHPEEAVPSPPQASSRATGAPRSLLGNYTKRFLDLAAANQIRVFYLLAPLPPHTRLSWDQSGANLEHSRLAADIQAYSSNVIVIEGRYSGYGIDAFYDDVHLNTQGATALSTEVASIMKQYLGQPRPEGSRVTLPPYHARGADPWLEDTIQTGVVLKAEKARRR